MKLCKTDKRFNLYKEGFTCYLEFPHDDWSEYNRYTQKCKQLFGDEFWCFKNWRTEGNWKGVYKHKTKRGFQSKRIYLKGNKFYTTLSLALEPKENDTFYL